MVNVRLVFLHCVLAFPSLKRISACTIFSAKDPKGNVWFGNNEDAAFSFNNFINVFPKSASNRYGYYSLSRGKPENGENAQMAGGMNEAGLIFDFNSTQLYPVKNIFFKKKYPGGDHAILNYLLGNFEHVEDVVTFFDQYWFQFGFRSAQMHLADRFGHFALVSPTGSRVVNQSDFQISTNYDICSKADSTSCWRYPIVKKELEKKVAGLKSFIQICQLTAQGRYTNYSSISNLNTGEITFVFGGEYSKPYKTSLKQLLQKGRNSYSMEKVFTEHSINKIFKVYQSEGIEAAYSYYQGLNLSEKEKEILVPNLVEYFVTGINNYEIYPFLNEYLNNYSAELDYWLVKAAIEYQRGELVKSLETIDTTKIKFVHQQALITAFMNRLQGKFDENSNAYFTLNGYENAQFVIVKSKSIQSTFSPLNNITFLTKTKGQWILNLKLEPGVYDYVFVVNGKEILEKTIPVKFIKNLIGENVQCHQLCLGMSEAVHKITVEVSVPNKEDEVYIVGNQEAIFKAHLTMMEFASEFNRSLTTSVHFPATFKLVSGGGKKKAVIKGMEDQPFIVINDLKDLKKYEIISWK